LKEGLVRREEEAVKRKKNWGKNEGVGWGVAKQKTIEKKGEDSLTQWGGTIT